ncbi:class I SAM-dependent methyltransferase [Streptomonospora sp. PA3]|uniref:class I SAM-dependent methyltransferase n=1 Tax=Streptomonospora sp. PA3 TaxID=2607326 RepID=UPI0012DE0564|nr:class I SAM-dependent methyltransferase [Streptomonospora sp. PA3]MUL40608.1 class I SAM-dependent methyltransferase [Streptomonospora sp. PA3]
MSEGTEATGQEYWDTRYRESERIWSGEPNAALVAEAADLAPGRALDLGCGEGADAVWLARRGWRVTAVDISAVALERAAEHAAEAGVADRIDFQRHDLAQSFPEGGFALVAALFLHSRGDMPRERILRTAAAHVVSGGTLLIVGHAGHATWEHDHDQDVRLPEAAEVLESLQADPGEWEVLLSQERRRDHASPGGHHADTIVKLRRR